MDYIKLYPRKPVSTGAGTCAYPGESAEVRDQNNIAAVGLQPDPQTFARIDAFHGKDVKIYVSDGIDWTEAKSAKAADEVVAEAKAAWDAEVAARVEDEQAEAAAAPKGKVKK